MLSSNIVRQTTFEIESLINKNNLSDIDNHVFISGLARSGTTILLNSIHKSNYFASLKYDDMPFILAPNLWSKITPNKKNIDFQERAHKDGIQISTKSPEAFEEIFWKTFYENNFDTHKKFRKFVSLVLQKNKKKRYISKNNQNIKRLEIILKIFPKSKILILFRNPIHQAKSLLNQHKKFINYSKKDKFVSEYMKWIGHHEFGPNYIPIIKVTYNRDYFKSTISNLDMNYDTNIIYERLGKDYKKTSKVYDFNNIFEVKDNLYISPDSFLKYINHKRIRFSKYSEGIKKLNLS